MTGIDLARFPVHLGRGANAVTEPEFTGEMQWYAACSERHAADGAEGRLVSMFRFREPWTTWEMHPHGSEVVICISGLLVLHQESADGTLGMVALAPGQYAINAPGVWHTADISVEATGVFITAGMGTEVRPR